jgi:hypothetical protein
MKCKNCGLPRDAHIPVNGNSGRKVWKCPNGSGDTYPAITDVRIDLHYRAGDDNPWVATWVHPTAGPGHAVSRQPVEALELAGRLIEKSLEEKTAEEKAVDERIKE